MARQFPPRSQRATEPAAPIQPTNTGTPAYPASPAASLTNSHTIVTGPLAAQTPMEGTSPPALPAWTNLPPPIEQVLADDLRDAPSLPIILVSAAIGVVAGIATFYLLWEVIALRLEWSVGLSTLALFFGLGATGGVLSAATGSRAALPNILFSCGTILLILLFFGICLLTGALGATLLLFFEA